uniref:Ig-like domain-containing protein n=1 Tax=Mola mola TaxID=94237 RepID=A0A3Q3XE81_MOLML
MDIRRSKQTEHSALLFNGEEVERVESFKFLGVTISADLTWSTHISHQVRKAQQRLYFLRKLRQTHLPRPLLTNFYRPTIESLLTYCCTVWNPFSNVTAHRDIIVLYGPDEPVISVHPSQRFHVSGDSLRLSCQAEGFPQPAAEWEFGGEAISDSGSGDLNITNVKTSQGGVYTCTLLNEETKKQRSKSILLNVYGNLEALSLCVCM